MYLQAIHSFLRNSKRKNTMRISQINLINQMELQDFCWTMATKKLLGFYEKGCQSLSIAKYLHWKIYLTHLQEDTKYSCKLTRKSNILPNMRSST